jgi:hypothetical protein
MFYNNRMKGWHVGLSGDPSAQWHWRILASFTRNWGIYALPFDDMLRQTYLLAEGRFSPTRRAKGWDFVLGIGYDHGGLLGNSLGFQATIRKTFRLGK